MVTDKKEETEPEEAFPFLSFNVVSSGGHLHLLNGR